MAWASCAQPSPTVMAGEASAPAGVTLPQPAIATADSDAPRARTVDRHRVLAARAMDTSFRIDLKGARGSRQTASVSGRDRLTRRYFWANSRAMTNLARRLAISGLAAAPAGAQMGGDPAKVTLKTTPVAGGVSMIEGENGFAGGNVAVSVGDDG